MFKNELQENPYEVNKIPFGNNQNQKPYYSRPTPVDLLIEEHEHYLSRATFDGTSIYEWNIDGYSEYQIQIKLHYMTMYATTCRTKGNSDVNLAKAIVQGFTGQLKGWWDFISLMKLKCIYLISRCVGPIAMGLAFVGI